jgi:hypothetical protein
LGKVTDPAGRRHADLAVVRQFLPGEQSQQCRLTGPVVADDTDRFTRSDRERDAVQDGVVAVAFADLGEGELSSGKHEILLFSAHGRDHKNPHA